MFIVPVRDTGCIYPGTFNVASFMASDVGRCLPGTFSTLVKVGAIFLPISFMLAKNFDAYELPSEAFSSPGMDVPTDLDLDNLPDPETMLPYHHVLTRYGTGSEVLPPGRCNLSEKNTTCALCEWWYKMFISLTCSPHANDSKRKQSDLFHMNISKDKGKLGSKPKLTIVRSEKPLEPFVPLMEDGSYNVKILGIDVAIPAMPIPSIPIQSIMLLPQVIELLSEGAENIMDILDAEPNPTECMGESDDVSFKEELAHIPLPSGSQYFPLIGRIPSFGKDLFNNGLTLNGSKGVCSPNKDEVESILAILTAFMPPPFIDITPLDSKFEGLTNQACDFKDLQQSYFDKLDEASHQLTTKGAHYEVKAAELKHVESRHEKLLKEHQLLEDQMKYLNS
ncbi:LOW QUALITY PROTEIN: hypothetical protein Cgig2_027964 [Carnegiea gigantea]|uniref:Uncharacterized protein n=1 Tax=Carnegiea gigantea TaxID=171969 RepID=A0A9Q1JVR2_9CARY|nr:LOW QUALITY PROTEIN: hypothetical protein Cgig2_027964 [Carnegiea gigantea]